MKYSEGQRPIEDEVTRPMTMGDMLEKSIEKADRRLEAERRAIVRRALNERDRRLVEKDLRAMRGMAIATLAGALIWLVAIAVGAGIYLHVAF